MLTKDGSMCLIRLEGDRRRGEIRGADGITLRLSASLPFRTYLVELLFEQYSLLTLYRPSVGTEYLG